MRGSGVRRGVCCGLCLLGCRWEANFGATHSGLCCCTALMGILDAYDAIVSVNFVRFCTILIVEYFKNAKRLWLVFVIAKIGM